jgi:hypothetical protein
MTSLPPAHRDDLLPVTVTVAAQDRGTATVLLTAPDDHDRQLLQLSYYTGTNTAGVIPQFWLMPPVSLRGSKTLDLTGSTVFGYFIMSGPSSAAPFTVAAPAPCYPTHPKTNITHPIVIPAGWMLAMAPGDADMDGTINICVITERRR